MRALFAAHPTVGHTQALRAIAHALRARGDVVDFAITGLPKLPSFVPMPQPLRAGLDVLDGLARDGVPLLRLPGSLKTAFAAARVASSRGYDELAWACRLFTADALASARVLVEHLERTGTDVVIADYAYFGAWLAAERAGVPFVALYHSGLPFPVEDRPPFGSGLPADAPRAQWHPAQQRLEAILAQVDGALAAARRSLGLPPVAPRLLTRPYAQHLNVLATFEAMELARPPGPVLWAGPCLGPRATASDDFPWQALEGGQPVVYVSLGTVFNAQPTLYRTLLEGVHHAGARAVVAAGASLEAVQRVARPTDVVRRFVPQVALLSKVSAFISHGGNNSTNEALRAGTPLVLVPFGGEQISNAQRAEALGVGTWLDAQSLDVAAVTRAVQAALTPERRDVSRALAAKLPEGDGVPRVVEALVRLAGK